MSEGSTSAREATEATRATEAMRATQVTRQEVMNRVIRLTLRAWLIFFGEAEPESLGLAVRGGLAVTTVSISSSSALPSALWPDTPPFTRLWLRLGAFSSSLLGESSLG